MPSFAHVIIGLGISIFLYKITEGKFSSKHALIFSFNNLFGPDISSFLPTFDAFPFWGGLVIPEIYYFTHGYGWPILALLLVLPWYFILGASKKRSDEERLGFKQIYFLIAAAGLLHLFVDIIGHPSYITLGSAANTPWGAVWIGWTTNGDPLWVSIKDILSTGMFPCGNRFGFLETYIFYGIIFVLIFGILIFYSQKTKKTLIRSFYIITIAYTVPLMIFYFIPDYSGFDINAVGVNYYGNVANVHSTYRLVGGEADLGIIIFFFLFFFVPLILLYHSIRPSLEKTLKELELKKTQKKAKKLETKEKKQVEERIITT
jgi:hypothetical protein